MAKLTSKTRNKLPKKEFALPGERKYPVNDASHAKNAKARASEMEHKGKISSSTKAKIDAKANKVLHRGEPKGEEKMSLLSSFITTQLVKALEEEFIKHEPELKNAFVDEVTAAVNSVVSWVNSKIALRPLVEAPNEER